MFGVDDAILAAALGTMGSALIGNAMKKPGVPPMPAPVGGGQAPMQGPFSVPPQQSPMGMALMGQPLTGGR